MFLAMTRDLNDKNEVAGIIDNLLVLKCPYAKQLSI